MFDAQQPDKVVDMVCRMLYGALFLLLGDKSGIETNLHHSPTTGYGKGVFVGQISCMITQSAGR